MKIIYKVITNNESINMCKNNNKSFCTEWGGGDELRSKSFVTYDNRQVVDLGEFRILCIVVFLTPGNALLR